MASERDPHPCAARCGQGNGTALDNRISPGNLTADSDLHVVNEKGSQLAVTQVRQLNGDA
jgi:hypothetical protein